MPLDIDSRILHINTARTERVSDVMATAEIGIRECCNRTSKATLQHVREVFEEIVRTLVNRDPVKKRG